MISVQVLVSSKKFCQTNSFSFSFFCLKKGFSKTFQMDIHYPFKKRKTYKYGIGLLMST
jgi:hypothetical protein